ncbi:hypothetical protein EDC01DRAFT_626531 [Geopyxis carbonaria]|nr:hypothetical protein EDC01DRAFT_626531 [Geopyxis carbonaria]
MYATPSKTVESYENTDSLYLGLGRSTRNLNSTEDTILDTDESSSLSKMLIDELGFARITPVISGEQKSSLSNTSTMGVSTEVARGFKEVFSKTVPSAFPVIGSIDGKTSTTEDFTISDEEETWMPTTRTSDISRTGSSESPSRRDTPTKVTSSNFGMSITEITTTETAQTPTVYIEEVLSITHTSFSKLTCGNCRKLFSFRHQILSITSRPHLQYRCHLLSLSQPPLLPPQQQSHPWFEIT